LGGGGQYYLLNGRKARRSGQTSYDIESTGGKKGGSLTARKKSISVESHRRSRTVRRPFAINTSPPMGRGGKRYIEEGGKAGPKRRDGRTETGTSVKGGRREKGNQSEFEGLRHSPFIERGYRVKGGCHLRPTDIA